MHGCFLLLVSAVNSWPTCLVDSAVTLSSDRVLRELQELQANKRHCQPTAVQARELFQPLEHLYTNWCSSYLHYRKVYKHTVAPKGLPRLASSPAEARAAAPIAALIGGLKHILALCFCFSRSCGLSDGREKEARGKCPLLTLERPP